LIEHDEQLVECITTNMKSDQEERKRDQEYQDLYWFTFPQGLRPVLCQLAKNSTKKINKINSIQYNYPFPRKSTLHPAPHNLLHPTIIVKQCRTLLHNPNYKPYAIWVTNAQLQITNPM